MANYKPNTKGVIARDTIVPPDKKLGGIVILIMLPFALLTLILYCVPSHTDFVERDGRYYLKDKAAS